MKRARAFALIVLVVLSALPASRAADDVLRVELAPDTIAGTLPGGNATTMVRVHNTGLSPIVVVLSASNATGGINVTFEARELSILPGGSGATALHARGSLAGEWRVMIVARERTALGRDGPSSASAPLRVLIAAAGSNATSNETAHAPALQPAPESGNATSPSPSSAPPPETPPTERPPPPPPARALVGQLEVSVDRGASAPIVVRILNPAGVEQRFDITLELPLGWGGTLETLALDLAAGATGDARASVTPTQKAHEGSGALRIVGLGGTTLVPIALRVVDPAPARSTVDAQEAPRAAEDPPAPTTRAPPPAEPTLRVVPSEIGASRGASVVVTLYVANPGAAPLAGRARLDAAPLVASIDDASFVASSDAEAALSFILTIPDDVAEGTTYEGVASTSLSAARVPFVVRIQGAEPAPATPVEASSSAPGWLGFALAGVGAGALAAGAAWRRWPMLGLLPLYARFTSDRALEHPRRAAIVELLRAQPGLTLADVRRRMAMSNGVARHHVALLEAAGILRTVPDGTLRRLWPIGEPARAVAPLRERVAETLQARGPMSASDLAALLGVSRQALHYHVKRLVDEGRIAACREQNEILLQPVSPRGA